MQIYYILTLSLCFTDAQYSCVSFPITILANKRLSRNTFQESENRCLKQNFLLKNNTGPFRTHCGQCVTSTAKATFSSILFYTICSIHIVLYKLGFLFRDCLGNKHRLACIPLTRRYKQCTDTFRISLVECNCKQSQPSILSWRRTTSSPSIIRIAKM